MLKKKIDLKKIARGVRLMLEGIGEDPDREGLQKTPERVADFYAELTEGMWEDAREQIVPFAGRFARRDGHRQGHLDRLGLRASSRAVRRQMSHRLYSERRQDRRLVEAGAYLGNFRTAFAGAGTPDAADRRDAFRRAEPARRDGRHRSRAHLHDFARRQKTGRQDDHLDRSRRVSQRPAHARRGDELNKRIKII
jgi:hypothetical protein